MTGTSIVLLAALLLASHLVIDWVAQRGLLGELISAEALSLIGFRARDAQSFHSIGSSDGWHAIEGRIPLRVQTNYQIRFVAIPFTSGAAELAVELIVPEDSPAHQRRLIVLQPSNRPIMVAVRLNSGFAPPDASLRIAYSGLPGIEIRDVQVFALPRWFAVAQGASAILAVAMLFAALAAVVSRRDGGHVGELIRAHAGIAGILAVSTIYAIAVIVRFSLYMATPLWSGDEYLYKSAALEIFEIGHHGARESGRVGVPLDLPNLLYPYFLAPTFLLGGDFYAGMRLVNSIAMNFAAFPVYFLARLFVRPLAAVGLAFATITTPFTNIGAFAVTEVLFYPVFLAFAWASVTAVQHWRSISPQLMVGALAATLLNIRPNGILLLPAYLFALICYLICVERVRDAITKPVCLASIITFVGTHWAIQWLLHGPGVSNLGFYGTVLGSPLPGPIEVLQRDPKGATYLLLGHVLTLAIPYAFPIGMLATSVMLIRTKLSRRPDLQALVLVAATLTGTLIATALVFTIKISPSDLGGLGRWHSRYYFHGYPLLLVVSVALWNALDAASKRARIAVPMITVVIVLLGATTLAVTHVASNVWFGSIADNMDVQWITFAQPLYWLFAVVTLVAATAWYRSERLASSRILIGGFATWCVIANVGAMETSGLGKVNQSLSCGTTAAQLVSTTNTRYAILGASRADTVGIGFWTWHLPQATRIIGSDSTIEPADIARSKLDMVVTKGLVGDFPFGRKILDVGNCRAYILN